MKYLTDREEIAYAMNFGKYPVVRINRESCKNGYNDFYEGDQVKVMAPSERYPDMYCTGRLYYSDGRYGVMTDADCLSADFGYRDVMEMIQNAQAPVLHAGQVIVVVEDFPEKRICRVHMMKVSDTVEKFVYPCVTLNDLPDDFDSSAPWNR